MRIYQLISSGRTSVIISVSVSDADSDSDADFLNLFLVVCCATLAVGYFKFRQVKEMQYIYIFFISIFIYFICTINCKGVPASTRPKKITLGSHYYLCFFLLACVIYICFFFTEHEFTVKKKDFVFIYYAINLIKLRVILFIFCLFSFSTTINWKDKKK